nr:MAG TPA: hypothetical protein [Caudoviricetes sp.]
MEILIYAYSNIHLYINLHSLSQSTSQQHLK